jgi:LytR cell envelope-related transcriptional attenuator
LVISACSDTGFGGSGVAVSLADDVASDGEGLEAGVDTAPLADRFAGPASSPGGVQPATASAAATSKAVTGLPQRMTPSCLRPRGSGDNGSVNGEDTTPSGWTRILLPPFLAVTAVAAILTTLYIWLGPQDTLGEAAFGRPTPTSPAAASTTGTPTKTKSAPPKSSPSTPTPTTSTSTPSPSTATPEESETPEPDRPEVVVLNQSAREGLASRVAREVRQKGWEVNKVGNFRGTVSTTTVYYPVGLAKDANALAKDLPGDPRVKERFSNLSQTRLTIVLTDDYGE